MPCPPIPHRQASRWGKRKGVDHASEGEKPTSQERCWWDVGRGNHEPLLQVGGWNAELGLKVTEQLKLKTDLGRWAGSTGRGTSEAVDWRCWAIRQVEIEQCVYLWFSSTDPIFSGRWLVAHSTQDLRQSSKSDNSFSSWEPSRQTGAPEGHSYSDHPVPTYGSLLGVQSLTLCWTFWWDHSTSILFCRPRHLVLMSTKYWKYLLYTWSYFEIFFLEAICRVLGGHGFYYGIKKIRD